MCGITGFVDYSGSYSEFHLNEQSHKLKHRGPNDSGVFFKKQPAFTIGLASRRLSVIDVSPKGRQPFISSCENFILVFNGTIYNHKELKSELSALGIKFISDSDTEVLLQAYIRWSETFLKKINGIFAFAIYDKLKHKLILARDPIGVKPLMYYFDGKTFIFGSELKVFLKHPLIPNTINQEALNLYFQYAFFPDNLTIVNNVQKLQPGERAEFNLISGKLAVAPYWTLPDIRITDNGEETFAKVNHLIVESVKSRLISDMPVGALLSGGYDSALVAAIAQSTSATPINTFSIGFEEEAYNEAPFAKKIAEYLGSNHHELYFDKKHIQDLIVNLGKIMDEPTGDSGTIALLLASQLASSEVQVLLSGEGGDELFGGYPSYFQSLKYAKWTKFIYIPKILRYNRYLNILSQKNSFSFFKAVKQYFNEYEAWRLTNNCSNLYYTIKGNDKLNELLRFDIQHYLPEDLLWKADRCMMYYGIENRDPLLDINLVQYAANLPGYIKCPRNQPKALLKQITHQYIPEELLNRPKKGFTIPSSKWLRKDLKQFTEDKVKNLIKRQLLNSKMVSTIYKNFQRYPESYWGRQLWVLLALELWLDEWMS